MRFKKILCPTDFSATARPAVESAVELATTFGGEVLLVHVVPIVPQPLVSYSYHFDVPEYERSLRGDAERRMLELAAELGSHPHVQTVVISGDPADRILAFAQENACDLIVMSTHGLTGWKHMVFGSVAEKVVRQSPCPVLTLRPPPPAKNP